MFPTIQWVMSYIRYQQTYNIETRGSDRQIDTDARLYAINLRLSIIHSNVLYVVFILEDSLYFQMHRKKIHWIVEIPQEPPVCAETVDQQITITKGET